MHKYGITIYWSNEDNVFIAEVPELLGCRLTATPKPPRSLMLTRPFNYGLTLREDGIPVPEPKGERLIPL